ncbi:hypothetical protein TPENAI_61260 [Tenacibaculum litopenaei]|uniref:hypothetical protein n=1 Tax=Tenacibaculum litopenaei TaxID=396016 RepID=UPI003895F6DC
MENKMTIRSLEFGVESCFEVQSNKIGIYLLLAFISLTFLGISYLALSAIDEKEFSSVLIIMILLFFLVGLPTRYLLWNVYGKELLVISKRSVSWCHDYGWVRTKWKTAVFSELILEVLEVRKVDEVEQYSIAFLDVDKETGLPVLIYETSVDISKKDYSKFKTVLQAALNPDVATPYEFTFSLN